MEVPREAVAKLELACGRPRAAAGGVALSAVRESREGSWGRRQGPKHNFQNFRDLSVNKQ